MMQEETMKKGARVEPKGPAIVPTIPHLWGEGIQGDFKKGSFRVSHGKTRNSRWVYHQDFMNPAFNAQEGDVLPISSIYSIIEKAGIHKVTLNQYGYDPVTIAEKLGSLQEAVTVVEKDYLSRIKPREIPYEEYKKIKDEHNKKVEEKNKRKYEEKTKKEREDRLKGLQSWTVMKVNDQGFPTLILSSGFKIGKWEDCNFSITRAKITKDLIDPKTGYTRYVVSELVMTYLHVHHEGVTYDLPIAEGPFVDMLINETLFSSANFNKYGNAETMNAEVSRCMQDITEINNRFDRKRVEAWIESSIEYRKHGEMMPLCFSRW